ncbi:hypothetical protein JCM21900_002739 [Sporobolomyces salmonicolor]
MVCPSSFTPLLRSAYPALPLQHCLPPRRTLATIANGAGAAGKKLRMIILGAPGAGKGTQSDWLLQKYDIDAIVVGQLLRNEIVKGTALGQYAEKTMKAGALLADDIVLDLVKPEIEKLKDRDWILDGFPRKASQAVLLDKILAERGDHLNFVASLRVPDKVILQRVKERFIHLPSGRTYNLSFNPPKTPGKDDVTGEPLSQRPDDNAATFANRLRSFHAENDPLLAHYDGAVVPFVGETSKEIWPKLESAIEEKFPNLKLR